MLMCRTDICRCKFSAKVSLMLGNPCLVPSLCKLNHISVCFIQISTRSPANSLFHSEKAMLFFVVIPSVLGYSVIFSMDGPCFQTIFPFLVTMLESIQYNACLAITGAIRGNLKKSFTKHQVQSHSNYDAGIEKQVCFAKSLKAKVHNIFLS